jgi:hypothetical protein
MLNSSKDACGYKGGCDVVAAGFQPAGWAGGRRAHHAKPERCRNLRRPSSIHPAIASLVNYRLSVAESPTADRSSSTETADSEKPRRQRQTVAILSPEQKAGIGSSCQQRSRVRAWSSPGSIDCWVTRSKRSWVRRSSISSQSRTVRRPDSVSERVSIGCLEASTLARFHYPTGAVEFSSAHTFSMDELLGTAAHETVHAIFHKARLNTDRSSPGWEARLLVEAWGAHGPRGLRGRRGAGPTIAGSLSGRGTGGQASL